MIVKGRWSTDFYIFVAADRECRTQNRPQHTSGDERIQGGQGGEVHQNRPRGMQRNPANRIF